MGSHRDRDERDRSINLQWVRRSESSSLQMAKLSQLQRLLRDYGHVRQAFE